MPLDMRRLLLRALEVILFCVLWLPIVISGIHNVREQTGHGNGLPWTSVADILSGWGIWLVGVVIWYIIIGAIGGAIFKKLGMDETRADLPYHRAVYPDSPGIRPGIPSADAGRIASRHGPAYPDDTLADGTPLYVPGTPGPETGGIAHWRPADGGPEYYIEGPNGDLFPTDPEELRILASNHAARRKRMGYPGYP